MFIFICLLVCNEIHWVVWRIIKFNINTSKWKHLYVYVRSATRKQIDLLISFVISPLNKLFQDMSAIRHRQNAILFSFSPNKSLVPIRPPICTIKQKQGKKLFNIKNKVHHNWKILIDNVCRRVVWNWTEEIYNYRQKCKYTVRIPFTVSSKEVQFYLCQLNANRKWKLTSDICELSEKICWIVPVK